MSRNRENDLEREIRNHLELEAEAQREAGLSAEQARWAARRAFGSPAAIAEQVREAWGSRWIAGLLQDLRFALRMLGRNKSFTAGATLPLAFAIGCAACALTLADAVLFRPLGVKQPDRLAAVYPFSHERNAFLSNSYPDFRDIQSLGSLVEAAAAFVRIPANVRLSEATERLNCELITGDYFRTTGVFPAIGRALGPEDGRDGAPPVALVSDALWKSRYSGSASVLGSVAWIDGVAFTIVGVMPRGYAGTLLDWNANPSFWIPLPQIKRMLPPFAGLNYESNREFRWLMTLARLRPDAPFTRFRAAAGALQAAQPGRPKVTLLALGANQARFFPGRRAATVRIIWILIAVAAAALAIACFNLASLLLARAAGREKEIAARLALGAGRLRLLRQFVLENAVLAGCACALGLPLALAAGWAAQSFESAFGLSINLSPDARALAASALAGLATAILAGVAPVWRVSRVHLAAAMKGDAPQTGRAWRFGFRDGFVALQMACAMAALAAATLLGQTMRKWTTVPMGYNSNGILIGTVDPLSAQIPVADRGRVFRDLLTALRAETRGAALAAQAAPTRVRMVTEGAPDSSPGRWTPIEFNDVSDGYFSLLRTPILAGRDVSPHDDAGSRPIAIVNRAAAELLWPGQEALGRRLRIRGEAVDREVSGVVANVRYAPLGDQQASLPVLYLPILQHVPQIAVIHALTPAAPRSFIPELRRIVGRTVREMPLSDVMTLEEHAQSGLAKVRLVSEATGVVSALGVALALIGVLAAGAYRVAQRRREIAIRIAVGAEPGRVIRSFAARGLLIGLAGSAAGLLPAVWAAGLLRSSLGGVETPGSLLFAASALALTLAAGAAAWGAARRIARIQPAEALRAQ